MEKINFQLFKIIVILSFFTPIIGLFISLYILANTKKINSTIIVPLAIISLLVNSVVIGSLIYISFDDSIFNESQEDLAKIKLDNIVKSIEYYKLLNSEYPDSLGQLNSEHPMEINVDFIQVDKSRNIVKFYYEKVGLNNYHLFSRGWDGMEFTKDDIYPSLSESKNIGLLIPEKNQIK